MQNTVEIQTHAPLQAKTEQDIRDWLVYRLAEILQVDPSMIDVRESLSSYSLGSSQSVELAGDLEQWMGKRFSETLLWDFPTIEAIAQHLS